MNESFDVYQQSFQQSFSMLMRDMMNSFFREMYIYYKWSCDESEEVNDIIMRYNREREKVIER